MNKFHNTIYTIIDLNMQLPSFIISYRVSNHIWETNLRSMYNGQNKKTKWKHFLFHIGQEFRSIVFRLFSASISSAKTHNHNFPFISKSNRICRNAIHHMATQMFFVSSKSRETSSVLMAFLFSKEIKHWKEIKKTLFLSKHHLLFSLLNCYIFNRVMNYNGQCNLFYWSSVSHWFHFTYIQVYCYCTDDIVYGWMKCLIHFSGIFRNKISCVISS